jgi:hypothetical protein
MELKKITWAGRQKPTPRVKLDLHETGWGTVSISHKGDLITLIPNGDRVAGQFVYLPDTVEVGSVWEIIRDRDIIKMYRIRGKA